MRARTGPEPAPVAASPSGATRLAKPLAWSAAPSNSPAIGQNAAYDAQMYALLASGGSSLTRSAMVDARYGDIVALAGQPIQRAAATTPCIDDAAIQLLAQSGTSGPGEPLPHLETIQKSFGPHDVTAAVAHTDRRATGAARAMGAAAFTTGSHVAFAGPPSLRTAAHEAAHVIQQRAGLQLDGGIGQVGDAHERHADAVADRVVAGESSVGLLAQYMRSEMTPTGSPLQRTYDCPDPTRCTCGSTHAPARGGKTVQRAPATDPGQSTLAEIHHLLSTGLTDWRVSESEAHRALLLLRALDPVTRLDVVMKMRLSGDWNTLRKHVPQADSDLLVDLEQSLDPHLGPFTRGDVVEIVFAQTGKPPSAPYTLVVAAEGLQLPSLQAPVPVIGLTTKAAVGKIAAAYTAYAMSDFTGLSLRVVSRGLAYSGRTMGTAPTEHAAIEARAPAAKHLRRRAEFLSYLADAMRTAKLPYEVVDAYQIEVEAHLDQHESPSELLDWALSHTAEIRATGAGRGTALPHQPWFDFLRAQQSVANQATGKDKARLQDTLGRFLQFFDTHVQQGDLDKYEPGTIWGRATVETMATEQKQLAADAIAAAAERAKDEQSAGGLQLYTDVLDLLIHQLLKPSVPLPRYVEARSQGVGYLYQSSPEELQLRRQIAHEILADLQARMSDPALARTSAPEFVTEWFVRHPLRREALLYASSHPAVEKFAVERDIPGWQIAVEVAVGFIPIIGQIVGAYEVASGEDLFGNELSTADRAIIGAAILLPAVGRVFKLGKGLVTARSLVSEYRLAGAEADAVYRAFVPIAPGSSGSKLLGGLSDDIRGRKAVDSARRAEAGKLLDQMGMTDPKTAEALRGGAVSATEAEQRVAATIERDIKALGPMTGETEALLRKNAGMRQALAESSLAARVLKKCASPCFPEGLTPEQIRRLEAHLEKMLMTGKFDEAKLREYLYRERERIDEAINWITNANSSAELDARVKFKLEGREVTKITPPEARAAQIDRAYEIGETHGREYAMTKDGLTSTGFENPFGPGKPWSKGGRYGKGIDDILAKGDELYVVEYKGAGSKLGEGQMTPRWLRDKIMELFTDDGTIGKDWARRLAKAWSEGKLKGVVYKTPVEAGRAGETVVHSRPAFGRQGVGLPASEP